MKCAHFKLCAFTYLMMVLPPSSSSISVLSLRSPLTIVFGRSIVLIIFLPARISSSFLFIVNVCWIFWRCFVAEFRRNVIFLIKICFPYATFQD